MADVLSAVRTYLLSNSGVTDLIGQRMYFDILPQNATTPAVTISKTSGAEEHTLSDRLGYVQTRIQFECFADKVHVDGSARLKANEVADAIKRSGICAVKGTTNGVDIRSVMVEDDQRQFVDFESGGGDDHRYVTSIDLMITHVES